MSNELAVLMMLGLVVALLLLSSGNESTRARPRTDELDALFAQTAREMARAEERRRQWLQEALLRDQQIS